MVDQFPDRCFRRLDEEGTLLVAVPEVDYVDRLVEAMNVETMHFRTEVTVDNVSKVA